MVKEIERRGEVVGTKAKSAILAGLSLAGRLGEALALYGALKREGAFPEAYAAGILLVGCSCSGVCTYFFCVIGCQVIELLPLIVTEWILWCYLELLKPV